MNIATSIGYCFDLLPLGMSHGDGYQINRAWHVLTLSTISVNKQVHIVDDVRRLWCFVVMVP